MSTRGTRGRRANTSGGDNAATNVAIEAPTPNVAIEAPTPIAPRVKFTVLCKEYNQLGGKGFVGSESLVEVQRWLRGLERIFKALEITDEEKCQLAAWQLKDAALNWWESVIAHIPEEEITWAKFREVFVARWMPEARMTQLFQSFIDLKQGSMTVAQYETKFNELSRYGPSLIDTSLKKNEMFISGMCPELRDSLIGHIHGTFTNLIDLALRFENLRLKQTLASTTPAATSNPLKRKSAQQKNNWMDRKGIGCVGSIEKKPTDISKITFIRASNPELL